MPKFYFQRQKIDVIIIGSFSMLQANSTVSVECLTTPNRACHKAEETKQSGGHITSMPWNHEIVARLETWNQNVEARSKQHLRPRGSRGTYCQDITAYCFLQSAENAVKFISSSTVFSLSLTSFLYLL